MAAVLKVIAITEFNLKDLSRKKQTSFATASFDTWFFLTCKLPRLYASFQTKLLNWAYKFCFAFYTKKAGHLITAL